MARSKKVMQRPQHLISLAATAHRYVALSVISIFFIYYEKNIKLMLFYNLVCFGGSNTDIPVRIQVYETKKIRIWNNLSTNETTYMKIFSQIRSKCCSIYNVQNYDLSLSWLGGRGGEEFPQMTSSFRTSQICDKK